MCLHRYLLKSFLNHILSDINFHDWPHSLILQATGFWRISVPSFLPWIVDDPQKPVEWCNGKHLSQIFCMENDKLYKFRSILKDILELHLVGYNHHPGMKFIKNILE